MSPPAVGPALRSVLRRHRRRLAAFAAWSPVEALPAVASGHLVALAVDGGFLAGRPAAGFGWLALLAVAVLAGALGTRQTCLAVAGIVEPFRDELTALAVGGTVHRSARTGAPADRSGVARLTHQVDVVRDAFAGLVLTGQSFLVVVTGALVGLATLVPEALALVLPPLLIGLVLFFRGLPVLAARQRDLLLAEERIAARAHMLSAGMRDVVACGAEDRMAAEAERDVADQASASEALARATALRAVALGVGGRLPLVLVLAGAPWLLTRGATPGMVLGALVYVAQGMQAALETLVRSVAGTAVALTVTWGRILETARDADAEECVDGHGACCGATGSGLALHGVSFAYGARADPVLRDLDLTVADGEHLAVVGPSGIGKSTLAGVLAGLLRPDTGEVLLDGVPLTGWDPACLVRRRVLIPQEAYVFAGTLRENLAYLDPDVTEHELDRAVRALGFAPVARRLGGYDATLGAAELADLSAGERQLVALVRAYVSPAPLIVLDEATCHLDPAAEDLVERAFSSRPGTLVVIAHRISSAMRARRILLLDPTAPVIGTHEELRAVSASYGEMIGHWSPGTRPTGVAHT